MVEDEKKKTEWDEMNILNAFQSLETRCCFRRLLNVSMVGLFSIICGHLPSNSFQVIII